MYIILFLSTFHLFLIIDRRQTGSEHVYFIFLWPPQFYLHLFNSSTVLSTSEGISTDLTDTFRQTILSQFLV